MKCYYLFCFEISIFRTVSFRARCSLTQYREFQRHNNWFDRYHWNIHHKICIIFNLAPSFPVSCHILQSNIRTYLVAMPWVPVVIWMIGGEKATLPNCLKNFVESIPWSKYAFALYHCTIYDIKTLLRSNRLKRSKSWDLRQFSWNECCLHFNITVTWHIKIIENSWI